MSIHKDNSNEKDVIISFRVSKQVAKELQVKANKEKKGLNIYSRDILLSHHNFLDDIITEIQTMKVEMGKTRDELNSGYYKLQRDLYTITAKDRFVEFLKDALKQLKGESKGGNNG